MIPMILRRSHSAASVAALLALVLAACSDESAGPATIEARIAPARIWYHTGQDILLTGFVTDAKGESLRDVPVHWEVEPANAATLGTAQEDPRQALFRLERIGTAVFTGCVVPESEGTEPTLCDSVLVRVDDGMPSLEIETPSGAPSSTPPRAS